MFTIFALDRLFNLIQVHHTGCFVHKTILFHDCIQLTLQTPHYHWISIFVHLIECDVLLTMTASGRTTTPRITTV